MTAAFMIEARGRTAGIALREDDRFLFFASDGLFKPLERQRFHSIPDLRAVVETVLERDAGAAAVKADDHIGTTPSRRWRRRRAGGTGAGRTRAGRRQMPEAAE